MGTVDYPAIVKAYKDTLRTFGWALLPDEGNWTRAHGAWGKIFTGTFGVGASRCRDALAVLPDDLVRDEMEERTRPRYPVLPHFLIYGRHLQHPGHPHIPTGHDDTVCLDPNLKQELLLYPPEVIGRILAGQAEAFYGRINPDSIRNANWIICQKCGRLDEKVKAFHCVDCNNYWCRECNVGTCQRCPKPIEAPKGTEPWAWAAQRFQWPPSQAIVRQALLIGCGVTGSWASLVLNRTCATVHAIDPDILAHPSVSGADDDYTNRSGVWGDPSRVRPKVEAIELSTPLVNVKNGGKKRMEQKFLSEHRVPSRREIIRFGDPEWIVPADLDLLVLCLDTATARLCASHDMARIMLDVRGTPTSCVFWALPGHARTAEADGLRREVREQMGFGRVGLPDKPMSAERVQAIVGLRYVCLTCRQRIKVRDKVVYDGHETNCFHAGCVYITKPRVVKRPVPRPDLWAMWRRSLESYDEAHRCGDHHDAVSLAAGTTTAYFLSWWIPAGLPVGGPWEVPFGIDIPEMAVASA